MSGLTLLSARAAYSALISAPLRLCVKSPPQPSRLTLLTLLCSIAAFAQTSQPSDPAAGARLFRQQCSSCHGKGGHGGRAPDLTSGAFAGGDRDDELFRIISKGIPGTEMAPYEERFVEGDIPRIIAYLHSATRAVPPDAPPVAGNLANGSTLFWGKGACGSCHAVDSRGNRVGPDLTRVGSRRSADYLRESLVDPSADILWGYNSATVVTRDGKTLHGIVRALDDFSVVLQDFSGKVYSFDRAALRSVSSDAKSLMPAYGAVFSPAELGDLLAYLSSLRKPAIQP